MNNTNNNKMHFELHLILGCLQQFTNQLHNIQNMLNAIDFKTMNEECIKIVCNQKVPDASFNSIFEFLKIQIENMETFLQKK
jgi:hypothetical protein